MAWLLLIPLHIHILLKVLEQNGLWMLAIYQQFYYYSCLTSYLVPLSGPWRQNCPSTKKTPLREEKKKGCSAILASPPALGPQTKKRMAQNFLSSSFPSSLYGCIYPHDLSARWMLQSCMTFHIVVVWGRYPQSRFPIWILPLSIPT